MALSQRNAALKTLQATKNSPQVDIMIYGNDMTTEKENMGKEGFVHSIESFGTVDGPGLRYVVFLQGCPLRCAYCHNPDTWEIGVGGKKTVSEILQGYESCRGFLKNGGITLTGGEPLMQMEFVTTLFSECKKRNIHTCLDTSGVTFSATNREKFDLLMTVTDLVMLDIKHIDSEKHKALVGVSNAATLAFSKYLGEIGKAVWIRHVVVPGVTSDRESLEKLGHFIGGISSLKAIDVLPFHKMGESKYRAMGLTPPLENTPEATKAEAQRAKEIIMAALVSRLKEEAKA